MKKILQKTLRIFAVKVLKKYKPEIVAITGSVGKTSTKEAVFSVLEKKFNVRKNIKNYNNEIGIPLTIIGRESGGKSIFKWIGVFFSALRLIILTDKNYPKILVLEMGADHPGDIEYLTQFARPKVGIITAIAPVHVEFFKNIKGVAREKSILIKNLLPGGVAILNSDDKLVAEMKSLTKNEVVTFGYLNADILASGINNGAGVNFKLKYKGSVMPIVLENIIAKHMVSSILPAIAVGLYFDMNLVDIADAIKSFKSPKGRMNKILGIKNTIIIDDTYNSSPLAAQEALKTLANFSALKKVKRFAVLGDMLELGSLAERAHQEAGEMVADLDIDILITVGELSRDIARGAIKKGMTKEKIFSFGNSSEAGKFLQSRISKGDIILVKGSQGVRMEKIVKEIMAEPQKAKDLLVRQGREWTI